MSIEHVDILRDELFLPAGLHIYFNSGMLYIGPKIVLHFFICYFNS